MHFNTSPQTNSNTNERDAAIQISTDKPEVGQSILNKREVIIQLLRDAANLEVQAAELRRQAYWASQSLEADASRIWSSDEIKAAKSS